MLTFIIHASISDLERTAFIFEILYAHKINSLFASNYYI